MQSLPGTLFRNPWIEFEDSEGIRICQPDAVWLPPHSGPIVIEAKLKQNRHGYAELAGLYMPVVEALVEGPVAGLLICSSLRLEEGLMFYGPRAKVAVPEGEIGTWLLRV